MVEVVSYPKEVKARKHHVCDFCGQRIMKDEKYLNGTYSFEGDIYSWKTHKHCSKIADRMDMYKTVEYSGNGLSGEDFQEIISNKHFELLIDSVPEEYHQICSEMIGQLSKVRFRDKLMYVIRYYAKLDKNK